MATNITFHPGVCTSRSVIITNISLSSGSISPGERSELLKQKGVTIWLTGLSASGKVTYMPPSDGRFI